MLIYYVWCCSNASCIVGADDKLFLSWKSDDKIFSYKKLISPFLSTMQNQQQLSHTVEVAGVRIRSFIEIKSTLFSLLHYCIFIVEVFIVDRVEWLSCCWTRRVVRQKRHHKSATRRRLKEFSCEINPSFAFKFSEKPIVSLFVWQRRLSSSLMQFNSIFSLTPPTLEFQFMLRFWNQYSRTTSQQ